MKNGFLCLTRVAPTSLLVRNSLYNYVPKQFVKNESFENIVPAWKRRVIVSELSSTLYYSYF